MDLEESSRLLNLLHLRGGPEFPRLRSRADRILARAYLNRAYEALKAGDSILARTCLDRSIRLSPTILGTIARDPRLAAQMAALAIAPRLAGRWLSRRI